MNHWLVALAVVLLPAVTWAQSNAPALAATNAAPRAVCDDAFWNFGRVSNTNRVEHAFTLRNAGGAELRIQRAFAGCGCAVVKKGAERLEPGAATQITVVFDLAGRAGAQRKAIYVHTNDPREPILRLELAGDACGQVGANRVSDLVMVRVGNQGAWLDPDRLDFGKIKSDAVTEGEITLQGSTTNDAVLVERIETGSPSLVARAGSPAGGLCRVTLQLKPERELGMGSATVTLRTTHPILRTVSVPVTWEASGDLYAIPEAVVLIGRDGADAAAEAAGDVAPAGPSRSVAVRSRSGRPFGLSQVETGGPDIRVTSTPLSEGKGFLLGLSGMTAATNAAPRALRIRTDDGTVLTVPIRVVPRAP